MIIIMILIRMTMGYGILRTDIPGYRVRKLLICNWTELTGYGIFGQKSNRIRDTKASVALVWPQ